MGSGCIKCSYKKRGEKRRKAEAKRKGSLAGRNTELTKEWHPIKNGDLKPTQARAVIIERLNVEIEIGVV